MALEPIGPSTAVELYLAQRENEVAQATIYSHRSRLGHFVRWCDERDVSNMNELTGRDLHEYRLWRREEGDLAATTEKTQMDTLRVFIRWCESIDAVKEDLSSKVQSPTLDSNQNVRQVKLEGGRAESIIAHLRKYKYASLQHVALTLLWHTAMRVGGACALDVGDVHPDEEYLEIRHRPEEGTPIKNKSNGERLVALSQQQCDLLTDWIEDQRPDVTDEFGRRPLLATSQGRADQSTIRDYCYRYTRPCVIGDCPHDRDPDDCEAMEHGAASTCPSSVSPHAVRRGSITYFLTQDVPYQVISDRANVSQEVLERHYDARTEREMMEQRRQHLE